jgi:hypothetical protein
MAASYRAPKPLAAAIKAAARSRRKSGGVTERMGVAAAQHESCDDIVALADELFPDT